jgi:hypothetical protein
MFMFMFMIMDMYEVERGGGGRSRKKQEEEEGKLRRRRGELGSKVGRGVEEIKRIYPLLYHIFHTLFLFCCE